MRFEWVSGAGRGAGGAGQGAQGRVQKKKRGWKTTAPLVMFS